MKKIFIYSVLIAMAALNVQSFAQPNMGMRGKMGNKGFMNFKGSGNCLEQLNLTEEQQTKIEALRFDLQEKMIALRAEIQTNKLNNKKLFAQKDLTKEDALSMVDKNTALMSEMKKLHVEHRFAVMNLLDDAQKEIFKENFAKNGFGMGRGSKAGFRGKRGNKGAGFRNGNCINPDGPMNRRENRRNR